MFYRGLVMSEMCLATKTRYLFIIELREAAFQHSPLKILVDKNHSSNGIIWGVFRKPRVDTAR
jgi:hypothetical protein